MMITGEEKFNRTGVFSTLENIEDISNIKEYSDLLGFTELEVEYYFSRWLKNSSRIISNSRSSYLDCLREYHNQFNFEDGNVLYNPLALLLSLLECDPELYKNSVRKTVESCSKFYNHINSSDTDFKNLVDNNEYVDKSELLIYTNKFINTNKKYICISRPRRFGKNNNSKYGCSLL